MERNVKLRQECTSHAESPVLSVYSVRVVGAIQDED